MGKTEYVGMDIFAALGKALAAGEQLRVVNDGHRRLRYAEPAAESHIQVTVKNGIITGVL